MLSVYSYSIDLNRNQIDLERIDCLCLIEYSPLVLGKYGEGTCF